MSKELAGTSVVESPKGVIAGWQPPVGDNPYPVLKMTVSGTGSLEKAGDVFTIEQVQELDLGDHPDLRDVKLFVFEGRGYAADGMSSGRHVLLMPGPLIKDLPDVQSVKINGVIYWRVTEPLTLLGGFKGFTSLTI